MKISQPSEGLGEALLFLFQVVSSKKSVSSKEYGL